MRVQSKIEMSRHAEMSAIISKCGKYRYRLDRAISMFGPPIGFILHNPSTADAEKNDPTSRRGIVFVKSWGGSHMIFINPWAGRATISSELWQMEDPIGPDNDFHIRMVAQEISEGGGFMVAAWGNVVPPKHLRESVRLRINSVLKIIKDARCEIRALGFTQSGAPRHPLYVPGNVIPKP